MAEISAQMVKQLRELTGAGMMECKNALVEAKGDVQEAQVILRKRGLATAAKKASRSAKEGLIGLSVTPNADAVTMVEVNCETDFVAKTEDFQALVAGMLNLVIEKKPADIAALLAMPAPGDAGMTVDGLLKAKIAKVGENMQVPRFVNHKAEGVIATYTHPGSKLIAAVDVVVKNAATKDKPEFKELAQDLAMQVAAADPKFLNRGQVTSDVLDKEKDIQRARALAEGKPEKIVDKVVEGRMSKFYEEFCLLEQPFIKENSQTITQLLEAKSKTLGDDVKVAAFIRYKVGETAPAEEAAAE